MREAVLWKSNKTGLNFKKKKHKRLKIFFSMEVKPLKQGDSPLDYQMTDSVVTGAPFIWNHFTFSTGFERARTNQSAASKLSQIPPARPEPQLADGKLTDSVRHYQWIKTYLLKICSPTEIHVTREVVSFTNSTEGTASGRPGSTGRSRRAFMHVKDRNASTETK